MDAKPRFLSFAAVVAALCLVMLSGPRAVAADPPKASTQLRTYYRFHPRSPLTLGATFVPEDLTRTRATPFTYETAFVDSGALETKVEIRLVHSTDELQDAMHVDAEIDAHFLYGSANISTAVDHVVESSRTSLTVAITAKSELSRRCVRITGLTPEAKELLPKMSVGEDGPEDRAKREAFIRQFGSHYVKMERRGAQLTVVLSLTGLTAEETDKVAIGGSLGVLGSSAKAHFNRLLKHRSSRTTLSVSCFAIGGPGFGAMGKSLGEALAKPTSIEGILRNLTSAMDDFTAETGAPLGYFVAPLTDIGLSDDTRGIDYEAWSRAVVKAAREYRSAASRADVARAIADGSDPRQAVLPAEVLKTLTEKAEPALKGRAAEALQDLRDLLAHSPDAAVDKEYTPLDIPYLPLTQSPIPALEERVVAYVSIAIDHGFRRPTPGETAPVRPFAPGPSVEPPQTNVNRLQPIVLDRLASDMVNDSAISAYGVLRILGISSDAFMTELERVRGELAAGGRARLRVALAPAVMVDEALVRRVTLYVRRAQAAPAPFPSSSAQGATESEDDPDAAADSVGRAWEELGSVNATSFRQTRRLLVLAPWPDIDAFRGFSVDEKLDPLILALFSRDDLVSDATGPDQQQDGWIGKRVLVSPPKVGDPGDVIQGNYERLLPLCAGEPVAPDPKYGKLTIGEIPKGREFRLEVMDVLGGVGGVTLRSVSVRDIDLQTDATGTEDKSKTASQARSEFVGLTEIPKPAPPSPAPARRWERDPNTRAGPKGG